MKRLLFSFLFVLTAIAGWAQTTFTQGDFTYTVTDEDAKTVSIAKAEAATLTGALVIPTSVTEAEVTYAVTSVADWAFQSQSITSVTIPSSIMSIGDWAFHNCFSLTNISIEDSENALSMTAGYYSPFSADNAYTYITERNVYIGRNLTLSETNSVFDGITSVEFGPNVTTINSYLFYQAAKLSSVTIGNGVTTIGDRAFQEAGTNGGVEEMVVTMGNGVTSIGEYAFSSCSHLKAVTLPSSLTEIKAYAFQSTGLTRITIPASVTNLRDWAFHNCYSLTNISIEDSENALSMTAGYYSPFSADNAYTYITERNVYIGRNLTLSETNSVFDGITSVEFGPNVTTINSYLFYQAAKLSSVTIGNGVTIIGDYAFQEAGTSVEGMVVTMGSGVTSIGNQAFLGCSKLTTITLPNTLTTIGYLAFSQCSSLASFSVPGSVTTIGSMAFDYCSIPTFTFEASNTAMTCSATIPCTNLYLGRDITFTESGFSGVSALTIGTNVTSIGSLFFYSDITSVTVPWDSPIAIDDNAFSDETFEDATLWIPGGTKDDYEAADGWKKFANMDFSSFVVSITGSAHGTLAVADISSTNGEEETTLIDRGEDAVFRVTPATGYEASTFTVNGKAAALTDNSYTVENLLADQTVVAGFTAINYTIGYDLAGGSVATPNPTAYTIESSAITLNNPTKTGYTFAGWTGTGLDAATTTVTIAAGSTGIRSYTATWTPIIYNIEYTMDDGTATPANPTTYTIETPTFTLTNPTKTGHTFKGWKLNGEGDAMSEVTIAQGSTGDKAYTATWQVNQYTITFNSNGGSAVDAITQDYGSTVTPPAAPTKTGYNFAGWTPELPETMPAENITVTATWTPTVYNIVYTDGGTATPANPTTYTIETATFTLTNPTKTGYDFAGWKLNGEGEAMMTVTITQGSTGNLAYTATWTPITYNIVYTMDGGTATPDNPTTYTIETETFTLTNPTKTGHTFAGWTGTDLAEPTTSVTIAAGSTGNRSYTATWTKKTYTVSITGGGVSADNMNPKYGDDVVITIAADEDRTLNTLTVNAEDVTAYVVDGQYTIHNVTGNVDVVATFNATKEFITLAQGVGTFSCAQDLNFTGSELKAYIAAGYNKEESQVLLVRVYDVPAGTGIYLKGEADVTYKIPYSTSQAYYVNMLKANLTASSIAKTSGDMSNFLLNKVDDEYGFFAPLETATLGAQKAYLQVPTSFISGSQEARAISIAFEDDETTNISDFELFTNSNEHLYNLKGQRVEKAGRGLYIKNGKKVVIK